LWWLWFEGSGGLKLAIGGKQQQQWSWSEVEEPKVPLRAREKGESTAGRRG
jgi:hypothetical protein